MRKGVFQHVSGKYCDVNLGFRFAISRSMLAVMHKYRPRFGVQKTALIAATAGCLTLGFASPEQVAVASQICPRDQDTSEPRSQITTAQASDDESAPVLEEPQDGALRVATLNANLSRSAPGDLFEALSAPGDADASQVANVVQQLRPDVLVLTGIDVDAGEDLVDAFNTNYLSVGQDGNSGVTYPYSYTAPSNAGVASGADLDRNGTIGGPGDALGYGSFPDQASMVIYSKYPIQTDQVRDFTSLNWSKMPDNNIPDDVTDLERDVLPMSSVSHWDVPIEAPNETVHILASSNADASRSDNDQARNQDQIRFWEDYLDNDTDYITDHRGNRGPLEKDAEFIIAGSLKADPNGQGPADPTAITSLLETEAITDPHPARTLVSSSLDYGRLLTDDTARYDTAKDPSDSGETYRADYVLPSSDLDVTDSGVLETDTDAKDSANNLFGTQPKNNANHIVWADITVGD